MVSLATSLPVHSGTDVDECEDAPEVSVVLPCLNEEQTIGRCIEKARWALQAHGISGEIVVCDNGSTDRSVEICRRHGVRLVHQPLRGYGNAYQKGIAAARGKYIVMADSDDTYDLREIIHFIQPLRQGYDLVMGNRFKGRILPGAMPWTHQYIGNPLLSGMLKLMFATEVGDSHSGIRSFTRETYERLRLRAPGMEFASEMVINAAKLKLRIAEVPVAYYPRTGYSKLRTMRDGWRHLRYMLLRSPTHLFFIPGLALVLVGLATLVLFLCGPAAVFGYGLNALAILFPGMCALAGAQVLTLGVFARLLAARQEVDTEGRLLHFMRAKFTLERGLAVGTLLVLGGGTGVILLVARWLSHGLSESTIVEDTKLGFLAVAFVTLGLHVLFSSFYLHSLLSVYSCETLGRRR